MHFRNILLFPILLLVIIDSTWAQKISGPQTKGPENGSLLICGGGALGPEIWEKFVALAGGENARIVIIPTALGDDISGANGTLNTLKKTGAASVTILHTTDPKEASKPTFYAPLQTATGVWFSGGRQWRIVDAYGGTPTQKEIEKVLDRGGVIGGSSAGATIQGSYLVRGDTRGNTLMMGDHTVGFGYLKNAAIDQHVMRRNRQFDLIPVIEKYPELLGIGIDESTGILIQKNKLEVIGKSYVAVYDAQTWEMQKKETGKVQQPFYFLSPGQQFDVAERKLIARNIQSTD